MCGIVGILEKSNFGLTAIDRDIFFDKLIADSVRGMDSTGVFSIHTNGNLRMVKQGTCASNFIKSKEYKDWASDFTSYRLAVGHNRKATTGDVTSKNAHPFQEGKIVLVHNGTFYNHKALLNEQQKDEVEVDSHALCHLFNEKGAEQTIKEINGAFALVWFDLETEELCFWRNSQRPLIMCESLNKIFFASEGAIIHWALKRDNRGFSGQKFDFKVLPVDKLVKIRLNPFTITESDLSEKSWNVHHSTSVDELFDHCSITHLRETAMTGPIDTMTASYPAVTTAESENNSDVIKELEQYNKNLEIGRKLRSEYLSKNVIFVPNEDLKQIIAFAKGTYEVHGTVYLPNKPPIPARWFSVFPLTRTKEYISQKKLVGNVGSMILMKDGSLRTIVENVTIAEKVRSFNKEWFPKLEWEHICEEFLCEKCAEQPAPQSVDYTVIKELTPHGTYDLTCSKCIISGMRDTKNVVQSSDTAVQNSQ